MEPLTVEEVQSMLAGLKVRNLPAETPARWAAGIAELCQGMGRDAEAVFQNAIYPADQRGGRVKVGPIHFASLCEHHLFPFFGTVEITYWPDMMIAGLSKFARCVDCLSRRPQLQERLTTQIAETVNAVLLPRRVLVKVSAVHTCMTVRGCRAHGAETETMVELAS